MTVYVVQESKGKDVLGAMKFGELNLLLPEGNQIVLSSQPTIRKLNNALKNFNDDDYLLLMGDPIALALATAIAARWNQGRVKFLKWDRFEHMYYPVEADISGREV